MSSAFELIVGMVFILITAMVFCNALEHLGEHLGISEGVTGSIFVAVGTALPEAIVPIIALFSGSVKDASEVGIGAIMGPPLMLSTLSLALMAFAVLKARGMKGQIRPERSGLKRDLSFFSFGYILAISLAFSHNFYNNHMINLFVTGILITSYFIYVLVTIKASSKLVADGHATEADDELFFHRVFRLPENLFTVIIQAAIGLLGLIYFAHVFIDGITGVADAVGIPIFLLSVVLIPVATELPEKVNSILWIRKGKDTLAVANITGAMVFQGLLLPVMGILFTDWILSWEKAVSCIATFIAVIWISIHLRKGQHLEVKHFVFNGILYVVSLIISFMLYKG